MQQQVGSVPAVTDFPSDYVLTVGSDQYVSNFNYSDEIFWKNEIPVYRSISEESSSSRKSSSKDLKSSQ